MRPARYFLLFSCQTPVEKLTRSEASRLADRILQKRGDSYIILSLTVNRRKNRCIPCIYWAAAIFIVVTDYSNLFLPLTFFLDCSHLTFGYELIVCPESADLVKGIRNGLPFI